MIELSGAPLTKFRSICSSIDKLDKEPWEKIQEELVNEKGVSTEVAENLHKFVVYNGPISELLETIKNDDLFGTNPSAQTAITELNTLAQYLNDFTCYKNITLDFSLARGLDYYTGVIYEAVLIGAQVGSIAGGGRYDELIGMFGSTKVNSVGVSIGIERMMVLLEEKEKNMRSVQTEVLIATLGKNLINQRLKMANGLWEKGIKTEFLYEAAPRADKQMNYALENQVPFMVMIGETEVAEEIATVKCMYKKEESKVPFAELTTALAGMVKAYEEDKVNGLVIWAKPEKPEEKKAGAPKGGDKKGGEKKPAEKKGGDKKKPEPKKEAKAAEQKPVEEKMTEEKPAQE